ncbi:MAG: ATP-dependent Clp protease ATP-binding subunit [Candidatus Nomurabacteria bacterium]|jgi:ATP-dependent Clp protease ATP-binding subunit ClpC|nr:ATP-dependent Clp protease ATP-binding subunit [Candidatus Nomurabacteria bacterium]
MMDEFSEIMNHLSENARFALQKADFYSKKYNQGYMGTEHLLMGILAQDTSTGAKFLFEEGVSLPDVEKIDGKVAVDVNGSQMAMMSLSEATVLTLRMSMNFARENGLELIGTEHMVYSLLRQQNSRAANLLTKLDVNLDGVTSHIEDLVEKQAVEAKLEQQKVKAGKKQNYRWLSRYGMDLTEAAKAGKLDTVVGRDQEIERTMTVLCRRTKSNPVLIGEAGVGKTAIVEGLATRIAKNDVPGKLIGKRIFQVDLSSVVAGTKFRGEFEERIKGIVDEATGDDTVILFIDELHLLNGAGAAEGSMDAANILKPALARNSLNLIGATTLDEYRKHIEKDKALARRFQSVMVNEPSATITLRILKGVKVHYETHHQVSISDDVLSQAIYLSERYINDRFMPDKVIDVIDEAAAIARVQRDKQGGGLYKKYKIELKDLEQKIESSAEKQDFEKAALYKTRLAQVKKEIGKLEKSDKGLTEVPDMTFDNLASAISLRTGIPISKVQGSEQKLLGELEKHLDKAILGQKEATKIVAKAIRRGRSGIASANRPIGSFIFLGPTGVGKTELAKVLAREVFGGENALIKIDMSEFGEKHNVSRLVGAPAGYVGYDDGGKLTEQIRRRPYSVVLFDEIEKAHPDVFNMLLQVLEDGMLTDGQGNKVKFNNTIVILTSNLGAEEMYRESELGFSVKSAKGNKELDAEHEENMASATKALRKVMKPELINRFDGIVTFRALTQEDVSLIFDNLLEDLRKRLAAKSIGLKISPAVKKYLIDEGFDAKNGARPLRRAMEDKLESLLADKILDGTIGEGMMASVELEKKHLKLSVVKE